MGMGSCWKGMISKPVADGKRKINPRSGCFLKVILSYIYLRVAKRGQGGRK
jgi:hypothetical protein